MENGVDMLGDEVTAAAAAGTAPAAAAGLAVAAAAPAAARLLSLQVAVRSVTRSSRVFDARAETTAAWVSGGVGKPGTAPTRGAWMTHKPRFLPSLHATKAHV